MTDDDKSRPEQRNTYRQGGAPKGGRSEHGPGSINRESQADEPMGQRPPGAGGSGEQYAEHGAPGSMPGSGHGTTGQPAPDLGRGWGRAPAPSGGSQDHAMPEPKGGAYEGWSGRTGQDYQTEGTQSLDQPAGPWARGGDRGGPPTADWHAERSDGTPPASAGDPRTFRGEAAYNQSVREPYGGYQGGYPGENVPVTDRYGGEYASWRAEQLKKLDEDYAAWCRERQERFTGEFEAWKRDRSRSGQPQADEPGREADAENQPPGRPEPKV